jgi:hypothetical protein
MQKINKITDNQPALHFHLFLPTIPKELLAGSSSGSERLNMESDY